MSEKPFPCQRSRMICMTSCWSTFFCCWAKPPPAQLIHQRPTHFLFQLTEKGCPFIRSRLTKEFTQMNIIFSRVHLCDVPKSSHISLSAGGTTATHKLLVSKYRDRFLQVSTFLSTLTPPPHILCSEGISWSSRAGAARHR